MTTRFLGLVAALVAVVTVAPSCADDGGGQIAAVPSSFAGLTVEIDAALGSDTRWIVAGSSQLVRQLADGADADLLVTADRATMRRALDDGLVESSLGVIARNRLVLALAPGNPGEVSGADDLTEPDLLLGVCAAEVPCGRLAAEAARALGIDLAADTEEANVRSLALKISRGELDAGLIYLTDASAFELETVDDDTLAPFITEYEAATVSGRVTGIVEYLRSDDGRALLTRHGFTLP